MSAPADPARALKRRLEALPARLRGEVRAALATVGDLAVSEAARALGASAGPQPAAPGMAPRDPAGQLAATVRAAPDEGGTGVVVLAANPHAAFLEYGTRTMAARPFLRPAAEAVRPAAAAACRAALARVAASLKEPLP